MFFNVEAAVEDVEIYMLVVSNDVRMNAAS